MEGGCLQPGTSTEAGAAGENKPVDAPAGTTTIMPVVRSEPFGGPFFMRLLALYMAGFLATTSLILGSWFLVMKPADATSAPPSAPASAVP
jgi:hypothetical protein